MTRAQKHYFNILQKQYILDNYKGVTTRRLTDMFNEEFGTNLNHLQIKHFKLKRGLKSETIGNNLFTQKQIKWIEENYKGLTNKQIAEKFNKEFGTEFTKFQFKDWKVRRKMRSGVYYEGRKPAPIGHEMKGKGGYVYVKIEERKYKLKHHVVWEEAYGKIPNNCVLIFKDGNRANCDLSNLKMVDRKLHSKICKQLTDDKDINECVFLLGDLKMKIKEKEERF